MIWDIILYVLATIGGLMVGLFVLFYILAVFIIQVEPFYDNDSKN
jgi:phage shock protein PspC (stress-responsive transcriptional regulator)